MKLFLYVNSKKSFTLQKISMFGIVVLSSVMISSILLSPNYASAASLTLTVPANGLRLDVSPTPEGTYLKSDVGKITIKTDAFAGYTVDIKAKTSSDLMNGENKISSISEETTEDEYQANGNKNTWTWQPSKFKSGDNTKFLPAPTIEPVVIEKTDSKNDVENNYDIYIATKVDNTLPTGEYKNDFVLTASANSVPYSIKYEIGEEATGAPEPNPDTGSSTEQTIKLSETRPTREDYEFLGWCSEETTDENCNGETKQPGDDITLTNSDNQFIFYAIWKPTIMYMQNWTGCNDLGMEETITLRDIRDNNDYTIAKLKDNRCWMTQNLSIQDTTLTPDDSNVFKEFVLPASNKTGFSDYDVANLYVDTENKQNGGYYTFFAATAGEGSKSMTYGETSSSICPKGWHLPNVTEYNTMIPNYSNDKSITKPPVNFLNTGYYIESQYINSGTTFWWTSTLIEDPRPNWGYLRDGVGAYGMVLNNNGFGRTGPTSKKYNGWHVRCISNLIMQDVESWGDSVVEGTQTTATDIRDGNTYTVSRLKDGNLWMTQNLKLGSKNEISLSPENTNVDNVFILPADGGNTALIDIYDEAHIYNPGQDIQKYGIYYNWFTATAGDGKQEVESGDVTHSICPKSWGLPTADEQVLLSNAYSKSPSNLLNWPVGYTKAGTIRSVSGIDSVEQTGFYWSSTALSDYHALWMSVSDSTISTKAGPSKRWAAPLRCIKRMSK